MDTRHFVLVQGDRRDEEILPGNMPTVGHAVSNAIHAGFHVGQPVRIGCVDGRVVGYNIGRHGLYRGKDYPLLVHTRYGVTKCSLREVAAA
jgi:hypothetical protein